MNYSRIALATACATILFISSTPAARGQTPPPPAAFTACCPPWNATQLQSVMVYQGTGGIGAPYTLKFNPAPQLHAQLNAYITYLQSLGLGINVMLINFQLSDAGTGATPVPGSLISNQPMTWTGSGMPSPNFFANGAMSVNRWYRIQTAIILGGTAGSTFLPTQCLISYIDVRIQVMPSPGARQGAATMQIRLADGRIFERPVPR